jgi:hypothetical protein
MLSAFWRGVLFVWKILFHQKVLVNWVDENLVGIFDKLAIFDLIELSIAGDLSRVFLFRHLVNVRIAVHELII